MLAVDETNNGQTSVITLNFDRGDYAGKQYRAEYAVCGNPVCECNTIDLTVREEGATGKEAFSVAINFIEKTLHTIPQRPRSHVENALLDNMTDSDWQLVRDLYIRAKRACTDAANLDDIETYFPVAAVENDSPLIGYVDVLPFAEAITIHVEGKSYLLDDQYCIKPHCDCQEVAISFLPMNDSSEAAAKAAPMRVPTIMLPYNKNCWSTLDAGGYAKETIERLANKIDDGIKEKLHARHEKIKLLYEIYKEKHGIGQLRQPVRAKKTAGRNDPCPCGSGQKYKRCCLNKEPSLSIDSVNQKK